MKHPNALLQLFCKTPFAGEVKTRLIPLLGPDGALSLYREMIERTVGIIQAGGLSNFEIWHTGGEAAGYFDRFSEACRVQQGADLGERMGQALQQGLRTHNAVVLVGADLPPLDADYVDQAFNLLQDHDVVLGPAEDGGYGLVGVRHEVPPIFEDMPWGTSGVLCETCRRLNEARANYALLPWIWDVDEPEEFARYERWRGQVS